MDDEKSFENRLNLGKTFLIGLGFFSSSLLWSVYNSFVPLILRDFVTSTTLIGMIMTIDNFFGVIFQPLFGMISDRTRTRIGKRMPYILIGAPVCGFLFSLIPGMKTVPGLMTVLILFNFGMSVWRSPMIALMPDLTPENKRSQANGVINLMGGLASILAFLVGGKLANLYGRAATFRMAAGFLLIAVLVLFFLVKEKKTDAGAPLDGGNAEKFGDDFPGLAGFGAFRRLDPSRRRSLGLILLAIFFWFCAFNALETFFTSYATDTFGLSEGSAAMTLAFFSVSFVAFALPAGLLGAKIGRRKTILIGLVGLIVIFLPMNLISNLKIVRVLLLIGGCFWAFININSLPTVLNFARAEELGTFTGYYYFFSFSAAIVSPILFGFIRDLSGTFGTLFIYAPICFVIALFCIALFRQDSGGKISEE